MVSEASRPSSRQLTKSCSQNDPTMTLATLAPVRDEGPSFSEHLSTCLRAVADLGTVVVLLDNHSIDGCCHGLPPEVLIVRTEQVELPTRLWRLGVSLASGESLLWLPGLGPTGRTSSARWF